MAVAGRIATHIDKVLVFHHLGAVAVATYTIAQLPTKYTGSTLSLIGPLVLPKLAKRDFATLQTTLPRKVRLLFVIATLVTVTYILLAPWLFALVFPSYPEAVLISQALALSIMLIPRSTYGQALIAHNKTKSLYILNTSMPALKLTLLYVLLPMYGIWGAVYAILASDSIGALLGYTFFKRTR
jgi:O-antigen/teichoic acid export membrane protein